MKQDKFWMETSKTGGAYIWRIVSTNPADEAYGVATIEQKSPESYPTREIAREHGEKAFAAHTVSTKTAEQWAGSRAELARRLGIERQAVYQWGEYPPPLRQYQIRELMAAE